MYRVIPGTVLLALFAILAPSLLSWVAWRGMAAALEAQFERRVHTAAAATASQISPADIADAQLLGEDGPGFAALQLQLEEARATTDLAAASLFDAAGTVVYDTRGDALRGEPTRLDALAGADVRAALGGRPGVTRRFDLGGRPHRAALVPVAAPGGRVAGVVAVEAALDYLPAVAAFGRTLLVTTLLLSGAIALFALLRIRQARAAERLERQLARTQTLAAMGRLTAALAHEIKNPLAIIRGSAERLGTRDPEARRMADFVVEESDRLSRTLARYLEFARGGEHGAAEGGDAVAALDATLALLEGEARTRRIEFAKQGAWSAAPVGLDNESLKQIYLNLILNAMDAMPEGGRITVASRSAGGRVEVTVADQGPGVPAAQLEMLGTPFHTTKAHGSGLGLFLSRRLAQSAGGDLAVRNGAGGGAECVLRLPARR